MSVESKIGPATRMLGCRIAPIEKAELRALTPWSVGWDADMINVRFLTIRTSASCFFALLSFDLVPDHDGADDDKERK